VQGDPIYRFPCDHGFQVGNCAGTRWTFVTDDCLKYGKIIDCYAFLFSKLFKCTQFEYLDRVLRSMPVSKVFDYVGQFPG